MAETSDGGLQVTVDASELKHFGQLLQKAADPKKLRRELAKDLRKALQPAVGTAKAAITGGLTHTSHANPSPALGPSIARNIKAEVRLSGRSTGARVKVKKTRNVRGFVNAPKLTNRDKWRRPVWGDREDWVDQVGKPDWFDDSMHQYEAKYRAAIMAALEDWARRITREVR